MHRGAAIDKMCLQALVQGHDRHDWKLDDRISLLTPQFALGRSDLLVEADDSVGAPQQLIRRQTRFGGAAGYFQQSDLFGHELRGQHRFCCVAWFVCGQ